MSRITMIQELDLVALLTDRPALGLGRGDVGTVVHIYRSGTRYEVEFMNAKGDTVGVETLTADEVQAVDLGRVRLHYGDLTMPQYTIYRPTSETNLWDLMQRDRSEGRVKTERDFTGMENDDDRLTTGAD